MKSDDGIAICTVRSKRDWRDFHEVRRWVYGNDRAAVLPLLRQERMLLDTSQHPFYKHADREVFIALQDGRPVARIAAIHDRLHQEYHGDRTGFFGFFESPDNPSVARALLNAAQSWLAAKNCDTIRGPVSPSMKGEFGVQKSGHEDPSYVMMAHTPFYYDSLLTSLGFVTSKTFHAYRFNQEIFQQSGPCTTDVNRICELVAHRHPELKVRLIDMRCFEHEIQRINELGNQVRVPVWGFVPLTPDELRFMARELRRIANPNLCVLVEKEQELVGYLIAVPDVNWALSRTVGRSDFIRLPQLIYWLRRIPRVRVMAFGTSEKHRHTGVTALLLQRMFDELTSRYKEAEVSWIVEDNFRSLSALQRLVPVQLSRIYCLYDRPVSPFI